MPSVLDSFNNLPPEIQAKILNKSQPELSNEDALAQLKSSIPQDEERPEMASRSPASEEESDDSDEKEDVSSKEDDNSDEEDDSDQKKPDIKLPPASPHVGSQAQLQQAIDARNNAQLTAKLGEAGETIARGFLPLANVDNSKTFQQDAKDAGHFVDDYSAKVANEKNDPNSDISRFYTQILADKFQVPVKPGQTSAAELEKSFPILARFQELKDNREAKHEDINARLESSKLLKDQLKQDKNDKQEKDYGVKLSKDFNQRLGGRGDLSRPNSVNQAADKLEALASRYPDLDKMPAQFVSEFVQGFNTMITQGQGNSAVFKKLLPSNLNLEGSKIYSWISSNPQGAKQKAFVQAFLGSVQVEKAVSQAQIKEAALNHSKSYDGKANDVDMDAFKQRFNITPEDEEHYKPGEMVKASYSHPDKQQPGQDVRSANLATFMKNNPGVSEEEAKQVLSTQGYH